MSDIDTTTDRLDDLATEIRDQFELGKYAVREVLDAQLAIGRCLMEARQLLPSDPAFGAWFASKEFGFSRQWGYVLRQAAEHEQQVRELVTSQLVTGRTNIEKAVKEITSASKPRPPKTPSVIDEDSTPEEKEAAKAAVFEPLPHGGADVDGDPIHVSDELSGSVGTAVDESAGGEPTDTPASRVSDAQPLSPRVPPPPGGSGKPTHKIPMREAGATLYRAITTLESLAADRHNGADVVDFWLDETGAHLDDIERQLAAAAEFIATAQIVISQRRRAA